MVQTDTSVSRNSEIRIKTKILLYPQNQLEFIQLIGDKLYDFCCVVYIDGLYDVMNTQNQER